MKTLDDELVSYVARYGGMCRGCADENGICPSSGLPCANVDKAIRHVIEALRYGTQHGYIPPLFNDERTTVALKAAKDELEALWSFWGQNLQVMNWHLNGEPEPWDNFFEQNDHKAVALINTALGEKK